MSEKLFRVVDRRGLGMSTDYESCIDYQHHDSMADAGYTFYVAGKKVAKNKVRQAVAEALAQGIGHPKGETVLNPITNKPVEEDFKVDFELGDTKTDSASATKFSKQVRCKETGVVYANQSAAAKDLGIDPAQVSDSIKTGRPRSGYTFERVPVEE